MRGKGPANRRSSRGDEGEQDGLTAAEMQFLDGREFSVEDIARFFRISPHRSATLACHNSNIGLSIDHATATVALGCAGSSASR